MSVRTLFDGQIIRLCWKFFRKIMVEEGAVDDSADLLNDCYDQIYDYFGDNMKFNEDTVVEFLRSNGYNVNEAIDYILEYCGVDQPQRTLPTKTKITTSSYTLPKSGCYGFVSSRHTGVDDR